MNIGLIGIGGMGKAIRAQALERGHKIVAEIDAPKDFQGKNFGEVDLFFEATNPSCCTENIVRLAEQGKDIVVATTGWYENMPEVIDVVKENNIRLLFSPNFSIGVNLYFRLVAAAAHIFNSKEDYDVWVHEIHGKQKADSPSGTAMKLGQILLDNIDRKTDIVADTFRGKSPEDTDLHISSTRAGYNNFAHTVGFGSASDVLEIKHTARNRDGYGLGAVKAGEWLIEQRPGIYTMEDFLTG